MKSLWDKATEKEFFGNSLKLATPEQLFYKAPGGRYLAYFPKDIKGGMPTLQSRNSFIGKFTEKWSIDVLKDYAEKNGVFAVQGVICEDIELKKRSPADIAFCKTNEEIQKPENIVLIFEVKMSVVWNWEYSKNNNKLRCIGDYTTHRGTPGLIRSDTMLKAIGKSISIRVSSPRASKIPIIILGNTPIQESYYNKVDHLKRHGIIQGFWSLNPRPKDELVNRTIKNTRGYGFIKMDSYVELIKNLSELSMEEKEFFSGMKTKEQLGKIIEIANKEDTYEQKAEKFLSLLRED